MTYKKRNYPPHWELKKMPQVVKWGSGGTPKSTESTYYENGTIPWLIIGDLNDGIVTTSQKKITKLGLDNSSAKMIPAGTLLVAMYGSIGKLGITGIECCTNQAIAYAKELYNVKTKYMYYFMALIKPDLISMGKGDTQKNISQTVLNSLYVPVPPIPEQERIVAHIEELFSELDAGVETLKKTKAQLDVYRQAVLKEAFENISTFTSLHNMAKLIDPEPSHRTPPQCEGGIPYVGIGDIDYKNKTINFASSHKVAKDKFEEHQNRYTLCDGDFIMGKIGTIGKPFRVVLPQNYTLSANVILIQPKKKLISPSFLFWQFSSPFITKQLAFGSKATTQAAFGIKKARLLSIKTCSNEKQKEIIDFIESKMTVCNNIEQTIDAALEQANALRHSILKEAFEGRTP